MEHLEEEYKDTPSLPVRGAWIEIVAVKTIAIPPRSLPVRGAWIEIVDVSRFF